VRTDDDSWIISTEVAVTFDRAAGEEVHDPVWVRVVAIPDDDWLEKQTDQTTPRDYDSRYVVWDKSRRYWRSYKLDPQFGSQYIVHDWVYGALQENRATWRYSSDVVAQGLLENVRVPVFGSPPKDWTKLAQVLGVGGGLDE